MIFDKQNQILMKTKTVLIFLNIITYIIFIGLCIQTGTFLFNFVFDHLRPQFSDQLYLQLGLKETFEQNIGVYNTLMITSIIVSGLKAFLFYLVIKLIEKVNIDQPFSESVEKGLLRISSFVLIIGLLGKVAQKIADAFIEKGYNVGIIEQYWDDADTFLLFSAVIFVIAHIFKKGIELQQENELTI